MNKNQEITDRNRKLRHLFIKIYSMFGGGRTFIRLVGSPNKPRVLIGESHIIDGYVSDNMFIMMNGDNKLCEINLNSDVYALSNKQLENINDNIFLRDIYKIRFEDSILYLSGYKYFSSEKSQKNGYPVFSKYNPKIFYDYEYAEKSVHKLKNFGYNVKVE